MSEHEERFIRIFNEIITLYARGDITPLVYGSLSELFHDSEIEEAYRRRWDHE